MPSIRTARKSGPFLPGYIISSSPVLGADGTIYLGSTDCKLYAVKPNGAQLWVFPTGGYVISTPAIGADGTIYVASDDGNLYAISIATFMITLSCGANGTINPSTAQIITYGSNLPCTATPITGYTVNKWSVDGTVVQTGGNTYTLTNITANHTINVSFKLLTFTVTPSSDANGTISPGTVQTVGYGGSLTFTATPNTGYTVNTWSLDGAVVQTGGSTFQLANITVNHTVKVKFKLLTYTITPCLTPTAHQPGHCADGELRQQPHLHRNPAHRLHGE